MKKINVLFIAVGIAIAGFMTSCSKDSTDTSFSNPTIAVNLDGTAVTGTVSKLPGTALSFDIKFGMGDQSDKLTNVLITSSISGKSFDVLDSTLNSGIFNGGASSLTYTYRTNVGNSTEKLIISITDKKDRTTTDTITITPLVVVPQGEFIITPAILMGDQNNATVGSFYSIDLGKILTISGAKSQSSYVDFVYYYGNTNKATLSSPANADAKTVFGSATSGIGTWSVKNSTNYKSVTSDQYGTTSTVDFDTTIGTIGTDNQITSLDNTKFVAFKTAGGKSGIIKVVEINTTSKAGYLSILIKMKK